MNTWQKLQARTLLSRAHSSSFSSAVARRTASNDSQLYSVQLQCRANRELRDPVIKWLGRWSRDSTASRPTSTVSSSTNHRITSCFYTSALHWFFLPRDAMLACYMLSSCVRPSANSYPHKRRHSRWKLSQAATLVGWIGGDFVYRKVAAKNIFLESLPYNVLF